MKSLRINKKNVATIVACFAVSLALFTGCKPEEETTPDSVTPPTNEVVYLKSPITENTTLKDLGLAVDYIYDENWLLEVRNNAILTIEPGVTIQFTNNGHCGGIEIKDGATIKAIGTAEKPINFIGIAGQGAGSWNRISLRDVKTDNELVYCNFIDGGRSNPNNESALSVYSSKVGLSHCTVSGSMNHGINLQGDIELTAFDNNTVERCAFEPVYFNGELSRISKFDLSSDFTNNEKPYIFISAESIHDENATLNETSVPYYIGQGEIWNLVGNLTINEGVTIYIHENAAISTGTNGDNVGSLFINGTPEKPVTLTRLPNTNYYWNSVNFRLFVNHKIKNCIIEYSGHWSGGSRQGAIGVGRGQGETGILELENVLIRNSEHYGIVLDSQDFIVYSNVTFADNAEANVWLYGVGDLNSLEDMP